MPNKPSARQRFTSAERARLLSAYHQSDLTQRDFALRNHLSVSCLSTWLRKSRLSKADDAPPAFIQMPGGLPLAEVSRFDYEIRFPGGHSLKVPPGFSGEELTLLCRIVRGL